MHMGRVCQTNQSPALPDAALGRDRHGCERPITGRADHGPARRALPTLDPMGTGPATTGSSGRILLVDDEQMVREVTTRYLERAGYDVETAADGDTALAALRRAPPALMILDVMLPTVDGLSVLHRLRGGGDPALAGAAEVPVILLTARSDELDRVAGLEIGADDYVTKPFSPRELVARVRSVLRRVQPPTRTEPLTFGDLVIDPVAREVTVAGRPAALTRREFDLLAFLASFPRQVFSRSQLLAQVWESSPEWQDPSTVTVHVRRLRAKVEADPDAPRWITTVWGVGYRFEP